MPVELSQPVGSWWSRGYPLWCGVSNLRLLPCPGTVSEVPTSDAVSAALSKALKKRGIGFIGPTSAYALMEAIGIIDTHPVGAHRRGISGIYPA